MLHSTEIRDKYLLNRPTAVNVNDMILQNPEFLLDLNSLYENLITGLSRSVGLTLGP